MKSEYERRSPVMEAVNSNEEEVADEDIRLDGEELQTGNEESLIDDEESQMDDGEWTQLDEEELEQLERELNPLFQAYYSRYGNGAVAHSLPPFQAILDLAEKRKKKNGSGGGVQ